MGVTFLVYLEERLTEDQAADWILRAGGVKEFDVRTAPDNYEIGQISTTHGGVHISSADLELELLKYEDEFSDERAKVLGLLGSFPKMALGLAPTSEEGSFSLVREFIRQAPHNLKFVVADDYGNVALPRELTTVGLPS